MGEDVERRRQFFDRHALEVKNLDVRTEDRPQ